jgi:uncharacterized protein
VTLNRIHVDQRKWPDRDHYQFEVQRLGQDEYGTWLHAPPGTLVRRGKDEPFRFTIDCVAVVPEREWWVAYFYAGHREIDVYVDIATPPVWNHQRLTYIDLDLDVIRRLDGTVEIIDHHEFDENRARYGYPHELVEGARGAADSIASLMRTGREPFGTVSERWLSQVEAQD